MQNVIAAVLQIVGALAFFVGAFLLPLPVALLVLGATAVAVGLAIERTE